MKTLTRTELERSLREGLRPLYLLIGPEIYLRRVAAHSITEAVAQAAVEPGVVVPLDPRGGGELDVVAVLQGPSWKTSVPMHSVLNSPMTVSISALS